MQSRPKSFQACKDHAANQMAIDVLRCHLGLSQDEARKHLGVEGQREDQDFVEAFNIAQSSQD